MSASLVFNMQPQQESEWCWAAVTSSIDQYFNAGSAWSQCLLANNQLQQTSCCVNGASAQCNCPWYLDRSLALVSRLRSYVQAVAPFAGVQQEINQNDPLGVRIGWSGGGGHFVVIYGYDDSTATAYVLVADPIWGISQIPYTTFVSSYRGNGAWTDSYYTQ
jgi:hypothetical protein